MAATIVSYKPIWSCFHCLLGSKSDKFTFPKFTISNVDVCGYYVWREAKCIPSPPTLRVMSTCELHTGLGHTFPFNVSHLALFSLSLYFVKTQTKEMLTRGLVVAFFSCNYFVLYWNCRIFTETNGWDSLAPSFSFQSNLLFFVIPLVMFMLLINPNPARKCLLRGNL